MADAVLVAIISGVAYSIAPTLAAVFAALEARKARIAADTARQHAMDIAKKLDTTPK